MDTTGTMLPTGVQSAFMNPQTMPQSPSPLQHTTTFPRHIYSPTGEILRTTGRFSLKHDDRDYKDFYALNLYDQALFTYESSNGYADGTYLVFVQREEYYTERRKISQRSAPAFKSIVDAMVSPVFEKPLGTKTNNQMFELFIENADNTGTTLQDVVETAQTHARVCGVTFIVMDNLANTDGATLESVLTSRTLPYIYEKLPQQIHKWHTTNWGKLDSITFIDKVENVSLSGGKMELRQYYRYWDDQTWKLYYETRNTRTNEVEEIVDSDGVHGLGFLPVYPILDYVKSNNLTNFPVPPLRQLINMAFILFNSQSLVKNLELYNFPILSLSNFDTSQLALGVTNALNSTGDSKFPPNFIVPPSSSIEVLTKNCDNMEEKMFQYAEQHGYIAAKTPTGRAQSGIKAEWDFRGTNSTLTKTVFASKKLYEWCAMCFGAYVKKPIELEVEFPTEFSTVYTQNRLDAVLNAIKEMPPEPLSRELWKEYTTVFFEDDTDRADKINKELDADAAEKKKNPPGELLIEGQGKDSAIPSKGGAKPPADSAEQPSALKDLIMGVMKKFQTKGLPVKTK
jgi:hypothetical protein